MANIWRGFVEMPKLGLWIKSCALGIVVMVVLGAFFAVRTLNEREAELNDAERLAAALTRALEQYTARTFDNVDMVLSEIAEEAILRGGWTNDFATTAAALQHKIQRLPQIRAVAVIDPKGRRRHHSDPGMRDGIDVTDRAYFRVQLDPATPQPFIDAPVRGRTRGAWFIPVSRSVRDKDGRLLGVVVAIVEPAFFRRFFESLDLGEGGIIGLDLADGRPLVHYPDSAMPPKRSFAEIFARLALDHTSGTFAEGSANDPTRRIVTYRAVTGYPLIIHVGLTEDEVLTEWRHDLWIATFATLGIAIVVGIFNALLLGPLARRNLRQRE